MSNTVTVGLGGKNFVVGLNWRPLDGKPKRSTLKANSAAYGDWGVVRKTSSGTWQAGFGSPIQGKKANKYLSLAAMVAESKEAPWRGIFKLSEDVYWYIAVRDSNEIIPNGDVVGTLDEILTVKGDQVNYGNWIEDIENGSVDDLDQLVVGKKANKVMDFGTTDFKPYIAAVVVLALLGGGLYYKHYKDTKEKERLALIAKQKREMELVALRKGGKILPWANLPSPTVFLNTCHQMFANTPVSQNGWSLDNWTCEYKGEGEKVKGNQNIKVVNGWVRTYGLAENSPGALINNDDTRSTTTDKINLAKVLGIKQKAQDYDTSLKGLWTLSEKLGVRLSLGDKRPGQVSLPGMAAPGTATKDTSASVWKETPFTMESDFSPFMDGFNVYLENNPIVYISSVKWEKSKWEITGKLYSKK